MSHSSEKFCNGFLLFFGKFLVSKSFMDEKARITFLLLKFLVSQCREISWASPQCFRQIGILKNSMHTRGYHVFASKLFGLTVPQNFVGIPSIFQKSWGIGNFYALMGYHNFLSKSCVSQCRKLLWASLQCFRNLGYRKILCNMGGITIFRRNIFVSQCRKIFGASLQCFRKFEVSKNFMHNRGYHNFSVEKFLSHSSQNFRKGNLLFLRKFLLSKSFRDEKARITFLRLKFLVSLYRNILWLSLESFRKLGVSKTFYA